MFLHINTALNTNYLDSGQYVPDKFVRQLTCDGSITTCLRILIATFSLSAINQELSQQRCALRLISVMLAFLAYSRVPWFRIVSEGKDVVVAIERDHL